MDAAATSGTGGRVGDAAHQVVIAGAGPTGLMLAGELALAGVDVVVVEPRADQAVHGSRAGGLHARTIEVLDQRGIAERFLDAGQALQVQAFSMIPLDISDFPTRHPYGLALWQSRFEPILAGWVDELGVPVLRERAVVGATQDGTGVDVEVSDGSTLRAQYLVGCDGGRSRVRRAAGIDSVGADAATSWLVAEVDVDGRPALGMRWDDLGAHGANPVGPDGPLRVVLTERELRTGDDPTEDELRQALVDVHGSDWGLARVHWLSRFTDATRQATAYRRGRVLVAGDAAHTHPPHGGQGLNTGVQDAVNLGWKLARVVHGTAPDALLDTYHDERHPVGARVLRIAAAQAALNGGGPHHQALRDTVAELLATDEGRRQLAGTISGLDIRYDLGDGHPLVGRRMPDLDLTTGDGPTRVATLLHDARGLLLDLDPAGELAPPPDLDGIRVIRAACDGPWTVPVVGEVPAPPAVLVRPDGHVAWVGVASDPDLPAAVARWFGTAAEERAGTHDRGATGVRRSRGAGRASASSAAPARRRRSR